MIVGTQGFYGLPVFLTAQGGVDVTAAAGANTTVASLNGASAAFVQAHPGQVVPVLFGIVSITLGATPPTAMSIFFETTLGTAIDTQTVSTAVLTASANLMFPIALLGAVSPSAWLGAGLTPLLVVNPTGQAVTVRNLGTRVLFGLIPGAA